MMKHLKDVSGDLILDSQDIKNILDSIGENYNPSDITGIVCSIEEGEYSEVWITKSNQPYLNTSYYYRIV